MKSSSKWLVFTLVAIAQFMVVLDGAITNVALPEISRELHFSANALQWVVTAYSLTFGGFLLLGGRAADLFGRKRTLMAGMAGFTLASLVISLSDSPTQLIALRALQGVSAAFMSPAALSIVLTTFRDGSARNKALSFWTLVATGGAALGLLLGGALTQFTSWRWNFLINVPIGIIMALLIGRFVPEHEKEETNKGLDLPGAALATSSLMLLVLVFSQAPEWSWTNIKTVLTGGIAAALMAGFIVNESKAKQPLMPLSIFKIRNVRGANMIMAPLYAAMMGAFFLLTLYIQGMLGFSPVLTGLSFLPFPLTIALTSRQMPRLVGRYGFKRFLVIGPLFIIAGLLWLTQLHVGGNYWTDVLPAAILMPLGIGMTMMPTIAAATSGVPARESGLASGLVNTSQQMGGALGLSILSAVAASVTSGTHQQGIAQAAVNGYHAAFLASAGFMLLAALVALVVIRNPRRPEGAADTDKPHLHAARLESSMGH